jgi:hypothetical protein
MCTVSEEVNNIRCYNWLDEERKGEQEEEEEVFITS